MSLPLILFFNSFDGIIIVNHFSLLILGPWVRALSRTYKTMYYGHPTKQAIYEEGNPVAAYAPFR